MKPSLRLHHGGISVKNMEESIAFYQDVFGFEIDTRNDVTEDFRITHMKLGDSYIELFWLKDHKDLPEHSKGLDTDLSVIGTKHIAFETDDPEAVYSHLESKGVEMVTELRTDNPDYKYFFFKDLNGILLEVVGRKS